MLKLIMVLLYMITEWLDWMKPMPARTSPALAPPQARRPVQRSVLETSGPPRTAHVGREVEDVLAATNNLFAVVVDAQVHQVELVAEHLLLREKGPGLRTSPQQAAPGCTRKAWHRTRARKITTNQDENTAASR